MAIPQNNLILRNLTLEPFDIVICDGPYGISEPECECDDFDLSSKQGRDHFRDYYRTLFDACLPHLKETASIFIFNYPDGASIIKYLIDEEYALCFRRWITWIYDNHHDFDQRSNFRHSHEKIRCYTGAIKVFTFHGGGMRDVLKYPIIKSRSSEFKDGAKPLEVISFLLKATCRPGGRLLSLFAGSGSDLIAAANYDMDMVGFEFNPRNIDSILTRTRELTHHDS